ncbi:MAG TPA: TetR/AcrR family transcriptional regulator [Silvibacterium sp.]|jgi:AcrR family transcriptional regulator|nr:TetR/AcrR family transcriptional regulator [Silvibacterium sp.]
MTTSDTAESIIPVVTEQVDRRKSLLQAAFDVIASSGFEGLRTRAVAERAGVNIATLHYYFPSKQALIEGLAQFLSGIFATLHAPSRPSTGRPFLDHLRQEFTDAQFYHERHPELGVVLRELTLRANRDAAVRAAMNTMVLSWRAWIETIVRGGIAEGTFRQDLDPQETIPTLMAVLAGDSFVGIEELHNIQRGVEEWLLAPEVKEELKGEKE